MSRKRNRKQARSGQPGKAQTYSEQFLADLKSVAGTRPDLFPHVMVPPADGNWRTALVTLDTTGMASVEGGLRAQAEEQVVVVLDDDSDFPPRVYVRHDRFVGVPHVLTEGELCIYLDTQREWDPAHGAAGFLNRLHDWFVEALANKFNPATALYHPIGGRAHSADGTPMVVCRDEISTSADLGFVWLRTVNSQRLDLHFNSEAAGDPNAEQVLLIRAPRPLFAGPGSTVREVFANLGPELAGKALAAWSNRISRQQRVDRAHTHTVLAVPNPAGGSPYLVVGRLDMVAVLEASGRVGDVEVQWCRLDDQRPSISTRRDEHRPVRALQGRDVVLVGCGGLGSWIAEFVARAGAKSVAVYDPAVVKGGLLVRQNYTDADLGTTKDSALANRLRAIVPDCDVVHGVEAVQRILTVLQDPDGLLIDATVSLAFARRLDVFLGNEARRALVAQVATDVATGSLGLVVVSAGRGSPAPSDLDHDLSERVRADGALEPYLSFWEPREHEEMIPAKGCSIPTFHGSAADMAAVAAEQVNLIAAHIGTSASGGYLFALPHSGVAPSYVYLPHGSS